jgi:hypothetical protein
MKDKSGLLQQIIGSDAFRIDGRPPPPREDDFMTILSNQWNFNWKFYSKPNCYIIIQRV